MRKRIPRGSKRIRAKVAALYISARKTIISVPVAIKNPHLSLVWCAWRMKDSEYLMHGRHMCRFGSVEVGERCALTRFYESGRAKPHLPMTGIFLVRANAATKAGGEVHLWRKTPTAAAEMPVGLKL